MSSRRHQVSARRDSTTSRASSSDSERSTSRAPPEGRGYLLGPVEDRSYLHYAPGNRNPYTGSPLSSSLNERVAPSQARTQAVTGSRQYPDGVPFDRRELRPQSATGYGATPDFPVGQGYVQTQNPYRAGTPIERGWKTYKRSDKIYAEKCAEYEDQALLNATTVGAIGRKFTDQDLRFSPEGHSVLAPYAREADLASLRAASNRLNHTSDHFGRQSGGEFLTGHLTQARQHAGICNVGSPNFNYRYHDHFGKGGSSRDWKTSSEKAEVYKDDWEAMEALRISDKQEARDHYDTHKTMLRGKTLSNGKYEWIAVGGGRKRYWSDEYDDYVEIKTIQPITPSTAGSSRRSRR